MLQRLADGSCNKRGWRDGNELGSNSAGTIDQLREPGITTAKALQQQQHHDAVGPNHHW